MINLMFLSTISTKKVFVLWQMPYHMIWTVRSAQGLLTTNLETTALCELKDRGHSFRSEAVHKNSVEWSNLQPIIWGFK